MRGWYDVCEPTTNILMTESVGGLQNQLNWGLEKIAPNFKCIFLKENI